MQNNEGYIYLALLINMIVLIVGYIIIRLWHLIKCHGVKDCKNRKCRFKEFCCYYHGGMTEEEIEELIKYVKERR